MWSREGSIDSRLRTPALAPLLGIESGKQKSGLLKLGNKADVNTTLENELFFTTAVSWDWFNML